MALSIKNLGEGQLAAAKATLYTCPGSTQAIVLLVVLVNESAADLTANLFGNFSGTSRRLTPVDVAIPAGSKYELVGPITLEAGDLIEGHASVANDIDYIISGVQNA